MDIFLSYPHKDKAAAFELKQAIVKGGHSIWTDEELITGQLWRDQLETQIKHADAVVLALTPNWVASPYCQWEFVTAVEQGKKIIPVALAKTDPLPTRLSQYQYADFTDGITDNNKMQRFLDDLLKLAVIVDPKVIADDNKEVYAMKIEQESNGGSNINVTGSGNTVAGGNIDQSCQSIRVGGKVSGGIVNIGGQQTFSGDISIHYTSLTAGSTGSPQDQLKTLLQELEDALKQLPANHREDAELVQEYANEIADEASKQSPRKKKLEITGENLRKAAENLASVAPIAAKIAGILLKIG